MEDIPENHKIFRNFLDILPFEIIIVPRSAEHEIKSQNISPVLFDNFFRLYDVSLALCHLRPVGIQNKTMEQYIVKRSSPKSNQASYHLGIPPASYLGRAFKNQT